ncbi:MAG: FHA domain-containing protein [Lachnospiraceae bacterium]|nr:FHA domain-containing protein [Lachnospiraceae bacterium]
MEKKNNGLLIVMKILVMLGAVILITGLFLPDVKLGFQEVEVSEGITELAETLGISQKQLEKELEELNKDIKEELEEAEEEGDLEEFIEEYGFNINHLKGNYSYISNYEDVDKAFNVKLNSLKWIVMIAAIVFALAAVIFAWLNVPIVSIISGILSGVASVGFMVFLIIKKFMLDYASLLGGDWNFNMGINMVYRFKMNFGFFILIAGAVVLFGSAIILTFAVNKAKKETAVSSENQFAADSNSGSMEAFAPQGGFSMEDQMTVPLMDVPVEQPQMGNHMQDQNAIHVGVLVLDGSMKGVKIPLEEGKTLEIGKDPQMASLVMDKSFLSVSRLHCTISFYSQMNQYYVTDHSSNGTFKSDGTKLIKGKRTTVARQTILYLATDKCKIKLL